ncbi:MAG TPA: hypothetical protein GXX20_11530 [Clostridiaceae bacterium]|nr:hypothetical protein [Clostridiaceae bacterium]
MFIARNTGPIWAAVDNIKIDDFAKIVYSKPGTGYIYHTLTNASSFAGQSFKAIGKEITEASIWLMSDTEETIILQILSGSINGTVIGEVLIQGGKAGKVTGRFDQPVNVVVGETYFLKVKSPASTWVQVQRQSPNNEDVGYYEQGTSNYDMALELKYKLFDSALSYAAINEPFNYVYSNYYAISSFKALDNLIKEVSLWLYEGNDDTLSVDIISQSVNGKVIATGSIPAGDAGKRKVIFNKQIYLEKDLTYYIKVGTGAPGTTSGSVAATEPTEEILGYTENGISEKDMAFEIIFTQWLGPLSDPFEENLELEPGYEESVNYALSQKIDVWGEELITSPEGPTYENIKDYLKPLMLTGTFLTDSGVYYIPFGRPMSASGGGPVALHVADGSQIISNRYNSRKMTVYVGVQGNERFGRALARLNEPVLDGGYYPILKTVYEDSRGVKYMQESFADYIPETNSLVSFVKIIINKNNTEIENVNVKFDLSDTGLSIQGNKLI